ncbi:MAG: DUF262 domain-containing protein [Pseudomonadota bacterium]
MIVPRLKSRPTADTLPIEDMLGHVRDGRLRVPPFQRALKWRGQHVLDLFDSIYRGFPVGDLLLAVMPGGEAVLHFGRLRIDAAETGDAWFIVDGQQRITALAGVLLHPDRAPYGDIHAVWFDLEAQEFRRLDRSNAPITWVPLNLLSNTVKLLAWLHSWSLRTERADLVERSLELSKTIREYKIPIYLLDGSNEEALRLIFKRVNTSGVGMEESEVFDALHGRGDSRPLEDACARLEETGFGPVPPRWFERVVRVVSGDNLRRKGETRRDPENVVIAEAATAKTISFLKADAAIPHFSILPYRLPLVVLARFFHLHPRPSRRALQLITRWVWRGALSGVHAASSDAAITHLCAGFDGDDAAAADHLIANVPREWEEIDPRGGWNARFAASRLFALGLLALEPRTADGARVELTSRSWQELSDLIASPLHGKSTAMAERMILTEGGVPLDRRAWRSALRAFSGASQEVLDSHALDERSLDLLLAGRRDEFVEARASLLRRRLQEVFSVKAGLGHSDRPAIRTLVEAANGRPKP